MSKAKQLIEEMKILEGETEAEELLLFINNEYGLYPQKKAIWKNQSKKYQKGDWSKDLSVKGFMHLVQNGAKAYTKMYGSKGDMIFDSKTKKMVAQRLSDEFEAEAKLGNFEV